MAKAPDLARGGRHQNLRHILSTSRTKRRDEIREAADKALRGVGGKASPGRRAVHQLEAFQTQGGAFDLGAELLRCPQQALGRRKIHGATAEALPLPFLDRPPPTNFAQDLVTFADHYLVCEIEPAHRLTRKVKRAPPQASFGALHDVRHQCGKLTLELRGRREKTIRFRWEGVEGRHLDTLDLFTAAPLCGWVEGSDRLHPVVIELHTNTKLPTRMEVNHPSAHSELPRLLHKVDAVVACR